MLGIPLTAYDQIVEGPTVYYEFERSPRIEALFNQTGHAAFPVSPTTGADRVIDRH